MSHLPIPNIFNCALSPPTNADLSLYLIEVHSICLDNLNPLLFILFCSDENGTRYAIQVNDFYGDVYVQIPKVFNEDHCSQLIDYFIETNDLETPPTYDIIERHQYFGWEPESDTDYSRRKYKYMRISSPTPYYSRLIYNTFKKSVNVEGIFNNTLIYYPVYEHEKSMELKFLDQTGLIPCRWFNIKNFKLAPRRYTHSQIELISKVQYLKYNEEIKKNAPILITSIDIEVDNPDGFPNILLNNIICISCYSRFSNGVDKEQMVTFIYKKKFDQETMDNSKKILEPLLTKITIPSPTGIIVECESELDLLIKFQKYIVEYVNPDIITGYNIEKYDLISIAKRMAIVSGIAKPYFKKNDNEWDMNCDAFIYSKNKKRKDQNCKTSLFEKKKEKKYSSIKDFQGLLSKKDEYRLFKFSRIIGETTPLVEIYKKDTITHSFLSTGRAMLDVYLYVANRPEKFDNLSLKYIATRFLNYTKEELDAKYLYLFYRSGRFDDIIAYCETDAKLPFELITCKSLQCLTVGCQDAFQFNVPLSKALNGGITTLLNYSDTINMHKNNMIDNLLNDVTHYDEMYNSQKSMLRDRIGRTLLYDTHEPYFLSYSRRMVLTLMKTSMNKKEEDQLTPKLGGGYVHVPKPGIYDVPVATLDFNSLYPSIMIQYNICYSSIVVREAYKNLPGVKYHRIHIEGDEEKNIKDEEVTYVHQDIFEGFICSELKRFLRIRKDFKDAIAKLKYESETNGTPLDTDLISYYDVCQLSSKKGNNSRYGFLIFKGKYYMMELGASVTTYGRKIIKEAGQYVRENYKHYNVDIVYGDTDSIMIAFLGLENKKSSVIVASIYADEIAQKITSNLPGVLTFENEKILFPYVLPNVKKKSMYVKYEKKATTEKLGYNIDLEKIKNMSNEECEGLINDLFKVQLYSTGMCDRTRGTPKYIKNVVKEIQNNLLVEKSKIKVIHTIYDTIKKIEENNFDLDDFIFIKKLNSIKNTTNGYHSIVSMKKEERFRDSGYKLGDFVPYVILDYPSASKVSPQYFMTQKDISKKAHYAEDPAFVKEYNSIHEDKLNLDKALYIEALKTQTIYILDLFVKNPEKLFSFAIQRVKNNHNQTISTFKFSIENFIKSNVIDYVHSSKKRKRENQTNLKNIFNSNKENNVKNINSNRNISIEVRNTIKNTKKKRIIQYEKQTNILEYFQ